IVLTSNNTRDLAAALKRRCLHLFLDYPSAQRELDIVHSKNTGLADAATRALVDVVRGLRELELRKAPSISETIDWARTLAVLGVDELTAEVLSDTVSVVVKYERDLGKARGALPRLVDPNATIEPERGHGHGHGHGHEPLPRPNSTTSPLADEEVDVDGRVVRATKDNPDRFAEEGHYGAPVRDSSPAPQGPTHPGRQVSAGQGARSFVRKRPV
ncbi:MAG: AAA family ATPase, partial [Sciscionella sp.]